MLKIGFLKADYVNDDLIVEHGDLPDMFARFFGRCGPVALDTYEVRFGAYPASDHGYDALVISGSRYSVNGDAGWTRLLIDYLASQSGQTCLIGFCFGHQALAMALGGKVGPREAGPNIGAHPLTVTLPSGWPQPGPSSEHLLFNHGEQVVEPPRGSIVLAGDKNCPNQIVEFKRCVLGIQAHPEYTIAYQDALMSINKNISQKILAEARDRNNKSRINTDIWSRWLTNYIKRYSSGTTSGDFRGGDI